MDAEKRFDLVTRHTEEVMTPDDLRAFIETGVPLKHYIGFEISGKVHLGTGLACMAKVKDFMDAGANCSVFLADWHSWINDKLGGDLDVIRRVAGGYFKEAMRASLLCLGGDADKLKFVLGSDLYHHNDAYWETVVDVAKHTTLGRISRSITIMGRKEGEGVDFAKMMYPPMQVADIFIQDLTLPHAGLDQRKAQVIARDVALKLSRHPVLHKKKPVKPVAVHHHLLLGLQKPPVWPVPRDKMQDLWSSMKMSKSVPKSAVFVHDSPEEIREKLKSAFCPEGDVSFNPVLDWSRSLLFRDPAFVLEVKRPQKFGGNTQFDSYDALESAFAKKELHPADLKSAVAESLITLLEPARKHFAKPKIAKMRAEMEKLAVTR